jgi:Icc-related predicted phosphoesterase
MAGRIEWLAAVERYSPMLVVCGHDHRSPIRQSAWHEKVRQTEVVNVGQKLGGTLHYSVIEMEFPGSTPCLPQRVKVAAFPWDQEVNVKEASR